MNPLDDLPSRPRSHEVEDAAIRAFEARLEESGVFVQQARDRNDYGTDYQIEVVDQGRATNARIHAQLKGTEGSLNADGSVSVQVRRTNLNYLLMQPHSFYVCYHLPTKALFIRPVETVASQYAQRGKSWTEQDSVTVTFSEDLSIDRLRRLAELAGSEAKSSRDRRFGQVTDDVAALSSKLRRSTPDLHVPDDPSAAAALLAQLYQDNSDRAISGAFEKFAAVLGREHDTMGPAYMAEINLGLARECRFPDRIVAAIAYFGAKIDGGRYQVGSLNYTIGNAHSALGDEEAAKLAYQAALADPAFAGRPDLAAQGHKNLGSSLERLGDQAKAVEHYEAALGHDPDLAEAHNALGAHYHQLGRYAEALTHFEQVVYPDGDLDKAASVAGSRANILFNLGEGRAAFREINRLVGQAGRADWIWPWCARQVASFGRATPENAEQAARFWERYVKVHPDDSAGRRELLLATLYLRTAGRDVGKTYAAFLEDFDRHMAHVEQGDAALLWDRLGHWAQDQGDWSEAERCFRTAYELEGGHFGYCLGTALNFLDRFEEAVPLLLDQTQGLQPDEMSWFQLGAAYARLGREPEAIDAYERALVIKPDYDLALFNLGGTHLNRGDLPKAVEVWSEAIRQFPEHEFAARVRDTLPGIFGS